MQNKFGKLKNYAYLCINKNKGKMTNLEMLVWGINHIANNHGLNAGTDYAEDGEVCIWGGCNVPTLSDVQMLCSDLHIERRCIETSECGIDIFFSEKWWQKYANKPYKKGAELWRRIS